MPSATAMIGERDVAGGAVPHLAAGPALHEARSTRAGSAGGSSARRGSEAGVDLLDQDVGEDPRVSGRATSPPLSAASAHALRSTMRIGGAAGRRRARELQQLVLPLLALLQLSSAGVAEPSRQMAPAAWARTTATSRAWYRAPPPACSCPRAPRPPRSRRGPGEERRRRSARRPRSASRRHAARATRRTARRRRARSGAPRPIAEHRLEAADGLRRECDLGHQHDRACAPAAPPPPAAARCRRASSPTR
jgi:hypothetical protein